MVLSSAVLSMDGQINENKDRIGFSGVMHAQMSSEAVPINTYPTLVNTTTSPIQVRFVLPCLTQPNLPTRHFEKCLEDGSSRVPSPFTQVAREKWEVRGKPNYGSS